MTPLGGHFGIDLYWLPLGAGGNFVRLNGRIYEAIKARLDRRPVRDLYHSALQVFVPEGRYVIENTPVIDERPPGAWRAGAGSRGARHAEWAPRARDRGDIQTLSYERSVPDSTRSLTSAM
jgi:hypothetical protein